MIDALSGHIYKLELYGKNSSLITVQNITPHPWSYITIASTLEFDVDMSSFHYLIDRDYPLGEEVPLSELPLYLDYPYKTADFEYILKFQKIPPHLL